MKKYLITNSDTQSDYGLEMIRLTLDEVITHLDVPGSVLGCDTETSGLRWLEETLLMLQIFNGKDLYLIDCQTVDIKPLEPIFKNENIVKIFHNTKFDYKFLKHNGIQTENVYDTMLVEKIIHGGRKGMRFALKNLMERYFNIEMDKEVRSSFINHKGDFTKAQLAYGLDDVVKLLEIRDLQLKEVKRWDLHQVVKLENAATLALADIEYNGLYLDKEAWEAAAVKVKKRTDELFEKLDQAVADEFPQYRERQMDMFGGGRVATINWNSPKQVLDLMQHFDPQLESAGAPALKHLRKFPLIDMYVEYKEKSKLYNAYGPDFYKYLHSDGRVHTNFDQILNTGRVSSRGPNMQQIPADNTYRNAFIPKDPDYVYVSSDFSAQELCIIAFGSKDPVWLKVLREGGDLHGTCAELIFGEEWILLGKDNEERKNTPKGKKLRTHVKTLNFGLAYGMASFALSRQLDITESEADALIERYFKTFPKIKGFLEKLGKYGKENGHIRTYRPFGRIRFFDEWEGKSTDRKDMSKIVRASKNTPIQGSGADMTKLALVMLRKLLNENDYPVKVVLTVHDEINTIVHKDFAEEWAQILKELMEKSATYIVGKGLLKSDPTVSRCWEK